MCGDKNAYMILRCEEESLNHIHRIGVHKTQDSSKNRDRTNKQKSEEQKTNKKIIKNHD
jgi:hypothetical protein